MVGTATPAITRGMDVVGTAAITAIMVIRITAPMRITGRLGTSIHNETNPVIRTRAISPVEVRAQRRAMPRDPRMVPMVTWPPAHRPMARAPDRLLVRPKLRPILARVTNRAAPQDRSVASRPARHPRGRVQIKPPVGPLTQPDRQQRELQFGQPTRGRPAGHQRPEPVRVPRPAPPA